MPRASLHHSASRTAEGRVDAAAVQIAVCDAAVDVIRAHDIWPLLLMPLAEMAVVPPEDR